MELGILLHGAFPMRCNMPVSRVQQRLQLTEGFSFLISKLRRVAVQCHLAGWHWAAISVSLVGKCSVAYDATASLVLAVDDQDAIRVAALVDIRDDVLGAV
jgi:hypothetical protein